MATKYVGFRLPIDEYEKFSDKAKAANLTLTEYLRRAVLSDETVIKANKPKASKDKSQLLYLYNKTSNNMNQLAHQTNTYHQQGALNSKQFNQILASLITIRNLLKSGVEQVD
ncbi:TPA: mobilization protein [Vibrio campbellii]|nr:mobilization protein [Vibrio campbellii]